MADSVGIVVPAYDPDVDRLSSYVVALHDKLTPKTIRIELDDPTDEQRAAAQALPAEVNVVPERRGKGAAITAGFESLSTDIYAFVDADGSTAVGSVRDVLAPVVEGTADLSVGSRRHPEATVTASQSKFREMMGDVFARVARLTLPVPLYDYQCGAKAITADGWRAVRLDLRESGFAWDVELIAAAGVRGLSVAEIPVEWTDRPKSTVDPWSTAGELGSALIHTQRLRLLGWQGGRPLVERVVDRD